MGKSMSTAKHVNRTAATKIAAKGTVTEQKPNQQMERRVQPVPSRPSAAYLEQINNIDNSFNDRLKQVFVTSVNNNPSLDLPKDRSMPRNRATPFTRTPHTQKSDARKPNKLLVDDVKVLLINYKENPEKWTLEYIAARYDIPKETAEKLVKNYSSLHIFFAGVLESDKYLHHREKEQRLEPDTPLVELEDIMTKGVERKWKTREEVIEEWMENPKQK